MRRMLSSVLQRAVASLKREAEALVSDPASSHSSALPDGAGFAHAGSLLSPTPSDLVDVPQQI